MLVDFVVENYRSIKEPVTLSAIAQARSAATTRSQRARLGIFPDNDIAPAFPVEGRGFELLPVLGIFGANASGKSNVIRALSELFLFMTLGGTEMQFDVMLPGLKPFLFDETTRQTPTRFEIRAVIDRTIYTYSLGLHRNRIIEERLQYVPSPPKRKGNRLVFERLAIGNDGAHIWKNGSDFGSVYAEIQQTINDNEPFVSFLVRRLNNKIISPLADWLRLRWYGMRFGLDVVDHLQAIAYLEIRPELLESVSEVIRRFDTGITRIEIVKQATDVIDFNAAMEKIFIDNSHKVFAWHDSNNGAVRLPLEEESTGTQRLFSLATKMVTSFQFGTPLVIDELGSNLHPHITRAIVRLFQNPETNPKRAQLIFTSHDNTLQQRNLLRRDQTWFTQKRHDGSTKLYSLSDFHPRNDLAIDKAYLDGRFGAIPILPSEEDLLPIAEAA